MDIASTIIPVLSFLTGFALGLYLITSIVRVSVWKLALFFIGIGVLIYILNVFLGISVESLMGFLKYLRELYEKALLEYVPAAYANLFLTGLVTGAFIGVIKAIIDYFRRK